MLLFTGNIQVWMPNIGTGALGLKTMGIRKNKRNWRKWMWWTEHREHKLEDSFKFWHDVKRRKNVRYIHSTCYVCACICFGWGFKLRICTMAFCSFFSAQLSLFVMEAFRTFATLNEMRKRATFHFHAMQKLDTYPIHWVRFDSIRFVSVPFCVYGNLWRYTMLWSGTVDHPRVLRKMISCTKFRQLKHVATRLVLFLIFSIQIIHHDCALTHFHREYKKMRFENIFGNRNFGK